MDHLKIVEQLARNRETIRCFLNGVGDEQACWKPSADDWSLLEVVNHLVDEEREDFRQRVDLILHRAGEAWPSIHPGSWVTERGYNQRDLSESLTNFLAERQKSIEWLSDLHQPDWDRSEMHPAGFSLSAGDLLASWLAHDFLHLRQLNELHYRWVEKMVSPHDIQYAGDW